MSEVKLTVDDYIFLDEQIRRIGYQEIKKSNKSKDYFRLEFKAPRPIKGSETGYYYGNNEYMSKIWISFLKYEQKFRDSGEDAGWPIITQGDELIYSARPIFRTKGFILKILRYAWVNKWKIDNIPLCPCEQCKARMYIFRKKGTRSYMFACSKVENHPNGKMQFRSWDYGLPPKAKEFVAIRRAYTAKYNAKNKKEDAEPIPKAVTRKKWKIGKPQNFIEKRD